MWLPTTDTLRYYGFKESTCVRIFAFLPSCIIYMVWITCKGKDAITAPWMPGTQLYTPGIHRADLPYSVILVRLIRLVRFVLMLWVVSL